MNLRSIISSSIAVSFAIIATGCSRGEEGFSDRELLERGKAGREVGAGKNAEIKPPPGIPTGPRPEGR